MIDLLEHRREVCVHCQHYIVMHVHVSVVTRTFDGQHVDIKYKLGSCVDIACGCPWFDDTPLNWYVTDGRH